MTTRPGTWNRPPGRLWAALAAALVAASLPACTKEVEPAEKEHALTPATLTPLKGDDEHFVVTLTPDGARRIALQTEPVRGTAGRKVIPYAALLYEKDGATYVYVSPKPRTYQREQVEVDRITGNRVLLRSGPHAGALVVTTGAAQVHGAELEYGEY